MDERRMRHIVITESGVNVDEQGYPSRLGGLVVELHEDPKKKKKKKMKKNQQKKKQKKKTKKNKKKKKKKKKKKRTDPGSHNPGALACDGTYHSAGDTCLCNDFLAFADESSL